jgi:diguanylate cyclase (GGDEF)-like protein
VDALRRRDLVGVLGWALVVGTLLGLVDVALHDTTPTPDQWIGIAATGLLAVWCRRRRQSAPRWLGDATLVWISLLLLATIAQAPDPTASGFLHVLLVWIGVLAFGFLPRRRAWAHVGWITVAAAGIWISDGTATVDVVIAAVLLLGTLAGVGLLVAVLVGEARENAHTDVLTGVPNRRGILAELGDAVETAARTQQPLSLLILDLDGFKEVNDDQGHAAGDELLQRAAEAWNGALRGRDRIGRLGGDEFLVVLPDADDEGAALAAARLRAATPGEVQVTVGRSTIRDHEGIDDALRRADADLYARKRARPGGVTPG